MKSLDIDKILKNKIIIYKNYIKPYFSKEEVATLEISDKDEKLLENLSKTLNLSKNLIFEAIVYYEYIEMLKEKDNKIISFFDLLELIKLKLPVENKILYFTNKFKLELKGIKNEK